MIVKLLELIKEEAEEQERDIASELFKEGAAIATAVCASLRGPEVFMMELSALRKHTPHKSNEGRHRFIDRTSHHHYIAWRIQGGIGVQYKYHHMSLASTTTSGIELRWWIETLIRIREEEGCITGPAFGHKDGTVALMREYDSILYHFLERIQKEHPNLLISKTDDIQANYGLS